MRKYKFQSTAGSLQEAYDDSPERFDDLSAFEEDALASMPRTMRHEVRKRALSRSSAPAMAAPAMMIEASTGRQAPPPAAPPSSGLDPHTHNYGTTTMFFYTIEEGTRVLMVNKSGKMEVVEGPARIWRSGRSFRPMKHYVAHPSEFLIVQFRDGQQKHFSGPAHVWMDPREHQQITKEDALAIADKEAIIVYAQGEEGEVKRRIVHGPATFVPEPGEWLHDFSWHGSVGGKKVPGALQFQKLWLLPDQMYHDVPDVRTADDAVLTIRLMMFFELSDIETMLSTTHDPIGDFLNAATSDVVDFVGRHSFESFKQNTEKLNETATYKQLLSRAAQIGYNVNRVVYRGYGAKASLEQMHDQAIESRTRLQLEKATEQQSQELEDLKQERDMVRAAKQRQDAEEQVKADIEIQRLRNLEKNKSETQRREFARKQAILDAEQRDAIDTQNRLREELHLQKLVEMGVDLTKYLTQNKADQVIELRGSASNAHVHLNQD